ncbi:unnamed protein product [Paramecium sonneborni]|uniref:RING-type domain-containing protein n=1 Tax=Paramecium sonneborni TaxID=65129 RepID=A0A8S1RH73_9CILI|nr:unnamed protein product [Paramecium sonneborni]
MLIPIFNFLLIIQITRSQLQNSDKYASSFEIDLDEYNNLWQKNISNENETLFIIKNVLSSYCYVRINLKQNDPSLILMADYGQFPNDSLIQSYKQGEKIDRISSLENRKNRFLKLQSELQDIYISVRVNNTDNQFQISISGSSEEECNNDCSNNGVCEANGCSCYNSFIGNDCHQIAEQLLLGTQKQFYFNTSSSFTFFYINLKPLMEHTLRIDLTQYSNDTHSEQVDNSNNCLEVWIYKSKALVQQLNDYTQQYFHTFLIEQGTQIITTKIPSNLNVQQQILWFAIAKDTETFDSVQLSIAVSQDDAVIYEYDQKDDNDETNKLLYIILPTTLIPITILLIIIYYLRKKKNQGIDNPNVVPKKQPEIENEPEKCAICFEGLNTKNKAVITIECNHLFHNSCIHQWGVQQVGLKSCPTCRRPFKPEELQ